MACQTPFRDDSAQALLFKIASCLAEGGAVAGVASFNSRTGVVTLTSGDVITALGFIPISQTDGDARYVLKSGDSMTGALSIDNGVLVANDPALELSQTWNNAAVTFTGLQSNITNTASAADSNLFNFQTDGIDRFRYAAIGQLFATRQDATNSGVTFFQRKRGNAGGATNAVAADATIGTITHSGWNGAAYVNGSRISGLANEAWTGIANGSRIDLYTTPDGSTSEQITLRLAATGQALFTNGTAALPALSFQTDLNTGIYRIGADSFGSSAGGSVILATSTTGINLTDALAYQYNSFNVIRAQTALNNYFFGPSGNLTMTGTNNTSVGRNAFLANTTGAGNTAVGVSALQSNTTGVNNSAFGLNALVANLGGGANMAVGANALAANTSGSSNTAVGALALTANTTGGSNSAIGSSALSVNISGSSNVAIGVNSLLNSTASQNSAVGVAALLNVSSGTNNTALGYATGLGITTGSNNTILGANVAGLAAGLANNIILADGAGVIRLQIDSSGNTTLAGTVATAAGTAALPAFTFSGDLNTGLYNIGADSVGLSTGGTLRVTTNTTDLLLATGFRLAMASGANQRAGNAVLVAGTVTVANTSVTANTIVMLTRKTSGGTLGTAITYTVIAATSFTITSDSALDTSTFSYLLIEVP